jgi:hypothetical protein
MAYMPFLYKNSTCLIYVLITIVALTHTAQGQQINFVIQQLTTNSKTIPSYQPTSILSGRKSIKLEMAFDSFCFKNPEQAQMVLGKQIEQVILIYTTYALHPGFNQSKLNEKRLIALYNLVPNAFSNSYTLWESIGQTDATSPESGRNCFHGFIVIYREDASQKLLRQEIHFLDSILGFIKTDKNIRSSTEEGENLSINATGKVDLLIGA